MHRTLTLLIAALALAACGSSDDSEALDWTAAKDPAGATGGLVWADAQTGEIHLSDGRTLDAERAISSFVIAGDGAYVVDKGGDALIQVTADGARPTGAHTAQVRASPNSRYLAFIDSLAGPTFEGSVHQLTSVVVDLKTGKEIFRSTRGMGDLKNDDLTDLYEDADHFVLGIDNKTAWIQAAEGDVLTIDLSSSRVKALQDVDLSDEKNPWVGPRFGGEPARGPASPDRAWGIRRVNRTVPQLASDPNMYFARDELESDTGGARLVPRTAAVSWSLDSWLGPTRVVGYANVGLENADRLNNPEDRTLMTCTVPDGRCTLVPGSERAILPEPSSYL
ncbi:hypothetical protein GEV29_08945 [Aeromicrobium sp. SMF47]|uniref:hypothetical protein n=1 Tax=Aeromicrobium yanjiei TaxID=2662028 RepID=UPI00129EAEEF|nr:hypothetical protein [Aeromicrobium yanjiei]MRJ76661.1 hypothetical protein [Aeromicrobium yanjiei]